MAHVLCTLLWLLIISIASEVEGDTGCSTVTLNHPDDVFCNDETCQPGQPCQCAVYLRGISGSCITVCKGFGMTCTGRHSDGPGDGHRCDYFNAGTVVEQCGDTGDSDDVCVCSKQSQDTTVQPTTSPTPVPPPPPPPPTQSPTVDPTPLTPPPTVAPTSAPTPLPPPSPTSGPSLPPTATPTSATTPSPTDPPIATTACSTVSLNHPDDEICSDEPCVGGICTCAVYLRQISGSCITVCEGFGMTCSGRHGDGPGDGHRCDNFDAGTVVEQCGATGDSDDVCVCSKQSPDTPTQPTTAPTSVPTPSPPPPTQSPTVDPTPLTPPPTVAPTSEPTPLPPPSPTSAPSLPPTATPTPATTPSPTDPPIAITACSTVSLNHPDDEICSDEPCVGGICTCAVYLRQISGSCITVCEGFGMTCSGRHGDGPGDGHRCDNFDAGTVVEQCGDTGDSDDVCVCSKPSSGTTVPPTTSPTSVPTPSPPPPTHSPTMDPTPLTPPPTLAPTSEPTPLPPPSPTSLPSVSPTATPTPATTAFPTDPPIATTACSTVSLNYPEDEICSDEPCVGGICSCAVYLRQMGGSCITVCEGFGMTCSGRHGDGPGEGHRCDYFTAGTEVEQCGDTGDSDDVCVCSKNAVPTHQPTVSPTYFGQTWQPTAHPSTPSPTAPPPTQQWNEANSISFGQTEVVGNLPSHHTAAESQGVGFEDKLYYFGGFDMGWWFMNKKSSMYTAASNQWRTLSDMPLANGGTGISHMGNTVWPGGRQIILTGGIGLGFSRNTNAWPAALSRQEVYTLNVDSRSWGRLPDMPGDRGGMGAAVVGSTLYVFGGGTFGWAGNRWDFLADHTDTWSLNLNNPNAGWSTLARMRTARNHIGAAAVNGIVYALGGQNLELEGCTNKNVVEAYNPATNRWTTISSMPVQLGHLGPSVLSPSMGFRYGMLVVSGVSNTAGSCSPPGNPQGSVQYFRPSSSSWTKYYFPFSGASMVTAIMEVNGVPYIYATSRDYGNSIQKLMRARMYIN